MNEKLVKLLKILHKNKGEYISGEVICQDLDITRTMVWKYIKSLRDRNYKIDSKSNRGYSLITVPEEIIPEELFLRLSTSEIGQNIEYFEEIGSTNEKAKDLAREGAESGTVVIAEEQKTGKGRLGRDWFSPPGTGLWFSLILRPDFTPEKAPFLTIIASLAVVSAFEKFDLSPVIKWPNDILIKNRKVCGILSELNADLGGIEYAVVGTGINVNQNQFPADIADKATSLKIVAGKKIDRISLLEKILTDFEKYYNFLMQEKEEELLQEWKSKLNILNKQVKIQSSDKVFEGTAVDVSYRGELMIKDQDGNIRSFWAGDASLNSAYKDNS